MPGDKALLCIDGHVRRQNIAKRRLAFKYRTGFTQLRFWMQRSQLNVQLFEMLVGDACHGTTRYQLVAVKVFYVDKAQGTVADRTHEWLFSAVIGITYFIC